MSNLQVNKSRAAVNAYNSVNTKLLLFHSLAKIYFKISAVRYYSFTDFLMLTWSLLQKILIHSFQ